jgi:hypothetical protein
MPLIFTFGIDAKVEYCLWVVFVLFHFFLDKKVEQKVKEKANAPLLFPAQRTRGSVYRWLLSLRYQSFTLATVITIRFFCVRLF